MRDISYVVKILVFALVGLALTYAVFHPVGAENVTINESFAIEGGIDEFNAPHDSVSMSPLGYIPKIEQGESVYINDTVDITGVTGWPGPDGEYRIAYYSVWTSTTSPEDVDPSYILVLPGKTRSGVFESQYRFYIDPAIFASRPGYWYQFTSNASRNNNFESAGNLRAFYVNGSYRTITNQTNTSQVFYPGEYESKNVTPVVAPLLPERHVTDYVVAKGDNLTFYNEGLHIWVFGKKEGIYDKRDYTLSNGDIQSLESGTYTLVMHYPGNNTIHEAQYRDNMLIPGLYGQQAIDVFGMSAPVVMDRFNQMIAKSDDVVFKYQLDIAEPYVTIDRIDETHVNGDTVLDVRGYTNAANGTPITVMLDEGRSYKRYIGQRTVVTTAIKTYPGNLSYYRAYLPLDYSTMTAANAMNHTVTARTSIGGQVFKDFWISILPADSYKPNATLKYIESSNPFVPTPTPEVVTVVQTQIVEKIVNVEVTPAPEVLNAAQKKAVDAKVNEILISLAEGLGVLLAVFLIGRFLYRVYAKRKWYKE